MSFRLLSLALLWGSGLALVQVPLAGLAPGPLLLVRLVLGAAVLLAIVAARRVPLPAGAGVWGHLAVAALLGTVVPVLLRSHAERTGAAGIAAVLVGGTPLLTMAVAAAALPAERATGRRVIGLLAGFLGVVVLAGPWGGPLGPVGGQLAGLGTALCCAAGFVYVRRNLTGSGLAPTVLAGSQLLTAAVLQALVLPVLPAHVPHLTGPTLLGIAFLGVLSTGFGAVLYFRLIHDVGATSASTVMYLVPVGAGLVGVLLLGEPLTPNLVVGGLVVLGGIAFAEDRLPRAAAIRDLLRTMGEDLRTVVERDPSVLTRREALLHPALPALWTHRVAHRLHRRGRRKLARLLMLLVRGFTGAEIHPGAELGRRVFIDHGSAVVIGETAVVGDDVTIFHQVTLGAIGFQRDNLRLVGERRHPVLGAGVLVGANATVLGPVTVGDGAVIGAQALVIHDVPAGGRALAPAAVVRRPQQPPLHAIELLRHTASAGSW